MKVPFRPTLRLLSAALALLATASLAFAGPPGNSRSSNGNKPSGGNGQSNHSSHHGNHSARSLPSHGGSSFPSKVQSVQNHSSNKLSQISQKIGGSNHSLQHGNSHQNHNHNSNHNGNKNTGIKLSDIVATRHKDSKGGGIKIGDIHKPDLHKHHGNGLGLGTGAHVIKSGNGQHHSQQLHAHHSDKHHADRHHHHSGHHHHNGHHNGHHHSGHHHHQHWSHHHACFPSWWYSGKSYCSVIVIPTQPVVLGAVVEDIPPMILLANLPENESDVAYVVNRQAYRTPAGEVQPLRSEVAEITFDRGGGFGLTRYTLSTGTYEFRRTPEGWQLFRKTFQVVLENHGEIEVFRFSADGKTVDLPAGKSIRLETAFPVTIAFDQGGITATRQLADGTFFVGASPETGKLDILAVE